MSRRYLFGPVNPTFAEQALHRHREAGECLAFDHAGGADLCIGQGDTWESVCARLPGGRPPDFVVLSLPYGTVPPCLWSAPVPLVGLAGDWNLHWHYFRRCLRRCELVLTDTAGVEALAGEGIPHARAVNLYGCERALLEPPPTDASRDIDILFVGNLHPAIQRERLPWLARLARLSERWRVAIRTQVYGGEYRDLLRRARVVFNRSIRGEANQRTVEATAAGALLFQEAGNLEVPAYFREGQEYVAYTSENLEALLDHYLGHEDERRAIADAGRARAAAYSYEQLWAGHLELIGQEWEGMRERARRRPAEEGTAEGLLTRTWQMLGSQGRQDVALVGDLAATLVARPRSAELHNALGLAITLQRPRRDWTTPEAARAAAEHFARAWECDPDEPVAGLNLAEALACCGDRDRAVAQARRVLDVLDSRSEAVPAVREPGHFPPVFDHFRVEWERAAWAHAGRPAAEARAKATLIAWRLHLLVAEVTGDAVEAYEATLARPDLAPGQVILGLALARQGSAAQAAVHLGQAVAANPFDRDVARALFKALGEAGDEDGQRRLAQERALLARAAPAIVPVEAWYAGGPGPVPAVAARPPDRRCGIVWEGAQLLLHSYAHVNRELCRRLIERGHEIAILPTGASEGATPAVPAAPALVERFHRPLTRPVDVHVRNQWPPQFTPPPAGHWVTFLFWEFGSLPRAWVVPLQEQVDEVWVPSQFVRRCCTDSGIPADRVHVVPLGIDPARFRPQAAPLPLRTRKRFKFLFVGGTIHRKGIDVLLDAYTQAFTARDDVCLVIKDLGAGTFYRGQTAGQRVADYQGRPGAPAIEYLDRELTAEELAGLYTACDCLVHPYRGEGFGLPIAEAMACALPVIVTGYGAARDFCNETNALLLPARGLRFGRKRVGDLETVDYPWLVEPDREALERALRRVAERPDEARAKGRAASEHIRRHFTWEQTADAVEARLEHLRQQPVRRSPAPADVARAAPAPGPSVLRAEDFEPAAPPGTELASILIPCCNQVEFTRLCLESVLRHTRAPYELVLVDNGSTDGTPAYMEEIRRRPGPERVEVIHNDTNRGFPVACNQALARARGRYVVLLNNDTIVTENWLDRLIKCVLHQWPYVGLVGPVTNWPPPQNVPVDYQDQDGHFTDLSGIDAFAARRAREYRGRAREVELLVGFCLLARREVLERVGAFDERFGLGYGDDNDFCSRARRAGFRLFVAADVFVHHFGGRTFKALGIDPVEQIRADRELFQEKWRQAGGGAVPAPAASGRAVGTNPRPRVSLCMIARNEADKLAACLRSVADLVDEMVVVDTGSADATREVASRCGARVVDFAWVDDFAAARNESVRRATGDWVFWLDADERLDDDNRHKLRALFAGLKPEKVAYVMRQLSESADGRGSAIAVDQVRLFPRDPAVSWENRVHEQILLSLRRAGHDVRWTDIVIGHAGWQDARLADRKLERNVRLLELQNAERPDDPVTLYHLGLAYGQQGRTAEALPLLRRSLERAPLDYSIRGKLYASLAKGHQRLGQREEALAVCRTGRREHPDDVELLFLEGLLLRERGEFGAAAEVLVRLLRTPPRRQFATVDPGLRTYKARHLLGEVYREQGRLAEAEREWRAAVAEQPDFAPAWQALGELCLAQGRWRDAETAAAGLERSAPVDAQLLRAQGHLARREFAEGRALLRVVIARSPRAVWPRLLLSRALVEEGRDLEAAERALQEVLQLDPDQPEARGNLAVVRRHRRHPAPGRRLTLLARGPDPTPADRAMAEIESAGGRFEVDEGQPGTPVILADLHGTAITDEGLARLAALDRLQVLYLGLTAVGDAGLAHLAGLRLLRLLALNGTKVGDPGLACLRELDQLQVLALGGTQVEDAGLAQLANRSHLETLYLNGTRVGDAGLAHLRGLPRLRRLDLLGTRVTDAGLAHLRELGGLQWLDFGATQVGDNGLTALGGLVGLSHLELHNSRVTDAGLESLGKLRRLRALSLAFTQVTDAGLPALHGLNEVRSLLLGGTRISDAGLPHLQHLEGLEELGLQRTRVSDAGLACLGSFPLLETLDLAETQVGDTGLQHVGDLTRLRALDLHATRITDAGLSWLRGLTTLQELELYQTEVTDAGLGHLAGLTGLRRLDLQGTRVGDAGLAHLRDLKGLEFLNLWGTQVSDAGLARLGWLTGLRTLSLGKTWVSDAGVAELRQALPQVEIRREGSEELLWSAAGKLLMTARVFPIEDFDTVARALADNPSLANRPLTEDTADRPLHYAAARGTADVLNLLLDHGADVNAPGDLGRTPLFHAALEGSAEAARLLLDRGAEWAVADASGETPLDAAARRGYEAVAALLERHGAVVDLNAAVRLGRAEQVRASLAGNPAVYRSARFPEALLPDAIGRLIGDEISRRDPDGQDPAVVSAVLDERRPIVEMLLDQGADPNAGLPLLPAVRLPDPSIARLLLERGADPNRSNARGLYLAEVASGAAMTAVLRAYGARGPDEPG
jgi:GT2 family glycosyltransferase/glycosyltransferase involved in cell wall biosynthesis/ankyrin repeat protein/predicted Zn-dependent protease